MSQIFLAFLPLLAVVCFLATITARAIFLKQRRIRVFLRPLNPSATLRAQVAANGIVFWTWAVLVAIYAWTPDPTWMPAWLDYALIDQPVAQWAGAVLVIGAVTLYPVALATMGNSWRVGIDTDQLAKKVDQRSPPATLITHGLFRFSRNPIYSMVNALFFGTFLIHGKVVFLVLALAFAAALHIQTLREEHFLAARYGDQYEQYRRQVGRYSPWL